MKTFARVVRSAAAGLVWIAMGANAQTTDLSAIADTYLRSGSPNQNQGDEVGLRVQSTGQNRALVRFDSATVSAALSGGSLARARLELFVATNADNWGSSGRSVDVHRLLADWSEGGATWNCGIDQIPSNSKPDCLTQWAGGLFAEEPTDSVLHTNGMSGWIAFDVTADVAAFANGESDFGWLVKKTEEGQNGQVEYAARESGGDTAPRLVLVVESPTFDEVPPKIAIVAPTRDVVVGDTTPQILVAYQDGGSGIEPASFELFVDSQSIGGGCTVGAGQAVCESPPLAAGAHAVLARVRDAAGNVAEAMRSFELLTGPGLHQAVFDAVADTYLRQGSANQNQGSESILRVRQSGKNRALVRFDAAEIASTLAIATVRTAHLELAIAKNGNNWGSSGRTIDAHRLTRAWSESGATWNCPDDSNPANQQADCSPLWNGGSMDPLPTATVLHSNGLGGTVRFDVTPDLAGVLAGAEPLGWLLKKTQEGQSGFVEYRSREDAAGPAPRLVVVFETTSTAPELPPDPAAVAPQLTPESAVDLFAGSSFLWTGEDPVQFDVAPGGIVPDRIALVRGRVLRGDGTPHAGVRVSVHREAEVGWTLSREDGVFDLAVNGGGAVTLRYEKDDYLGAFRSLEIPAREWVDVDDVVLIQLDPVVTQITPGLTEMQVARGSVNTDEDGSRQATLFFPGGFTATMTMADGSSQPLPTMHVRATEYTVGPLGPQQMPAELPENTMYNYAVDLSVDEASAAGAKRVEFSQPIVFYIEDFVGFAAGLNMPSGFFDRERAVWVPEPDGRVIRVLATSGGIAELDLEGEGIPADESALEALGIGLAERQRLAALYPPNAVLWRIPIGHFSPWDFNVPFGPPMGAVAPPVPEPVPVPPTSPPPGAIPEGGDDDLPPIEDPQIECGSILDCANRRLRERIDLVGTPFALAWASDRDRNTTTAIWRVRLTDESIPTELRRVSLDVSAVGWRSFQNFAPATDLIATVVWPQVDRWLRRFPFDTPVRSRICYYYQSQLYLSSRRDFENSFSRLQTGGAALTFRGRSSAEISVCRDQSTELGRLVRPSLGGWDSSTAALGGWTLDVHHRYNPLTGALFLGDGSRRLIRPLDTAVHRFAGSGTGGDSGDGGPARDAQMRFPTDVAFARDGSMLIADIDSHRIRRVTPTGTISTFAGNGATCEEIGCGDGGPAVEARLSYPRSVAIDRDGSVLIGEDAGCLRRVDREGVISTVYGDCFQGPNQIGWPADLLVGPGGGIYVADAAWNQVRYLGSDGALTPLAGDTDCDSTDLDVPALTTSICSPGGLAFDADGQVLVAGGYSNRVLRIRRDGVLELVAGNDRITGGLGDGGPATNARLDAPFGVAARPDGSVLIADTFNGRIRRIAPHGQIRSLTAGWDGEQLVEGMPPERLFTGFAEKVAIGPDNRVFLVDSWDPQVLVIGEVAPLQRDGLYLIPSEDASEIYVFDEYGLHLRTVNALTGAALLRFGYDSARRLISITDFDGNVTLVERAVSGAPSAIVGPFGQRTILALNGAGDLAAVTNPAGETISLAYGPTGDLRLLRNARLFPTNWTYDIAGKLRLEDDAAGGWRSLSGSSTSADLSSTVVQTAEGRRTDYTRRLDSETESRWTTRYFSPTDRVTSQQIRTRGGGSEMHRPDGSKVTSTVLSDPIWGPLVRTPDEVEVRTPSGGLGPTTTITQIADLANYQDPLTVTERTTEMRVNGRLYRSHFDRESLTWTFTTPAGRASTLEIDEAGRPVRSQVGDLEPVSYAYDGRGRLASIAQGGGFEQRTVDFAYDGLGRLFRVTDPLLRQVTFAYDAADRVIQQDLPGSRTVLFDWDANGNLISLTPPGKPAHLFDYTPVDLPAIYEPPDVGVGGVATDYAWNLDKNPDTITRPDGAQIVFGYDFGQRPVSITSPRGTQTIQWEPNRGRIQSVTTPEGVSLSYLYDGPLVTRTTWSGGGISGRVDRSYDDDLRLRTISVNGANAVTYAYDADSLLRQAGSLLLTRDPETGLLAGTTLGNVTTSYTYNGFGELASMTASFGATPLYSEVYTRDALGRIVTRVETIQGTTTTWEYGYDAAGRLETVTKNGLLASQYAYDANGNRLAKQTPTVFEAGTYDAQDRMLTYAGASYTYTANGETLTKTDATGTTSYQYDVFGNLLGVDLPNGTQIRYKVDGRNRRIERSVNGVVTQRWLWQGQLSPIAELSASNAVVSRFVYATRVNVPDSMIRGGATYRILHDHLGSPRLVVNTSTGAIAQRMDFDEWGIVTTDRNPGWQPFGFGGGMLDTYSLLHRFGARDYGASSGRWVTRDHVGFALGTGNQYSYVEEDPANFVDKIGLVRFRAELEEQRQLANELQDELRNSLTDEVKDFFREKYGVDLEQALLPCDGPVGKLDALPDWERGEYDKWGNFIQFNADLLTRPELFKATLLHELVHWAADEASLLGDHLPTLDSGLLSEVNRRGYDLSGGEAQLAFARHSKQPYAAELLQFGDLLTLRP
jgi:RHS repeat-associated protein